MQPRQTAGFNSSVGGLLLLLGLYLPARLSELSIAPRTSPRLWKITSILLGLAARAVWERRAICPRAAAIPQHSSLGDKPRAPGASRVCAALQRSKMGNWSKVGTRELGGQSRTTKAGGQENSPRNKALSTMSSDGRRSLNGLG